MGDSGKWGYIDRMGQLAIPAQFDGAESFRGGLARVRVLTPERNTGLIDKQGVLRGKQSS